MSNKYYSHDSLLPFYLSWQTAPDNPNYNLAFYYKIKKYDHVEKLIHAVNTLISISPHLRQTFQFDNKKLISIIHDNLPPNLNVYNASKINAESLIKSAALMPHDLNHKSAIHLNIIRLEEHSWVVFNIHHILMDGVSLDQFIKDLNMLINGEKIPYIRAEKYIELYNNETTNKNKILDKKSTKYIYDINTEAESLNYKKLNSVEPQLLHYEKKIPHILHKQLIDTSNESSLSIFNLLLITSNLFLSKIFNTKKQVITYPINIRSQTINGCFVKLIPISLKTNENDDFFSVVEAFKKNLSFYKKIARLNFDYNNEVYCCPSFAQSSIAKPLPLIFKENKYEASAFPQIAESMLSIKYQEADSQLYITCDLLNKVFPEYLAGTILQRYFNFIENLMDKKSNKISRLSLLFEHEKTAIINNIKNSYTSFPKDKSICDLIENYAETNPDNTALIYNNTKITYFELNARANQIARHLLDQKKTLDGSFIAIFLSRNPLVIISMLGVLKTGAAYVSLSKNSPDERIKFVLEDTKTQIIITELDLHERIKSIAINSSKLEHVIIDDPNTVGLLDKIASHNIELKIFPDNIAHAIYTSGTTGIPKGVLIGHKNIVSLVKNAGYIKVTESDTFVLFADLTFDAATFEIWGALLNCARLFIPTDRLEIFSDSLKFKEMISNNQVTVILLTKTIFDQLYHSDQTIFSPLNYLLIGGEALNKTIIEKLSSSQHKPTNLINAYGPTENTTISTIYQINYESLKKYKTVPIGKSISNRIAFALDVNENLLPPGIVGELYVGGEGLSKGYLNQKKLSKEKFTSILLDKENIRTYRTGDLVRCLDDGNLEYLGRNDNQIKIRGYRIELSEIENILSDYPEITEAIVLLSSQINKNSNRVYLVAYYKTTTHAPIDGILLNEYLRKKLPEYMLPTVLVYLMEFPITTSGKLDIKKLPLTEPVSYLVIDNPTNLKETIICNAYAKVLNVTEVGINNDFFDLGGNSILAIELSSILHNDFNIHVSDIFKLRTPRVIAKNHILLNNNIEKTLKKIKHDFIKTNKQSYIYRNLNEKVSRYFDSIYEYNTNLSLKKIENIVLTGSTGYLGCNILRVLLKHTSYNLFLLIRADSIEIAVQSINRKFKFYFDEDLTSFHNSRVFVIKSDLEKDYLGTSPEDYLNLVKNSDSIIHCAALTKHYGEYNEFYSANVKATINLLELSKKTIAKDFHFISTISTLDNNYTSCEEAYLFTEDDVIDDLQNQTNFYIKTKHEGEKYVIKYREYGITSNIYRVGNLAFISENFRVQENLDDNAFFSRMKCLLTLKTAAKEIGLEEISPVDLTAQAIVKLMNKNELSNQIFHVFNPNLCNIVDHLSQLTSHNILVTPIDQFLDCIANYLSEPNIHQSMIMRFLLHQNWLDGANKIHIINFVLQSRTHRVLKTLGFEWPHINQNDFNELIKHISI